MKEKIIQQKIKCLLGALEPTFNKLPMDKKIDKSIWRNKHLIIKPFVGDNIFDVRSIEVFAKYIKLLTTLHKRKEKKVLLDLTNFDIFRDKNTYIMLDLLILYLINKCENISFHMIYEFEDFQLENIGLVCSTFIRHGIGNDSSSINKDKFNNLFFDKINTRDSEQFFYRNVVIDKEFNDKLSTSIGNDIFLTLKSFLSEKWSDAITKVIEEIICNAYSHNPTACIINIDYCGTLISKSKGEGFQGINISILNLGDNLLYTTIQNKIENNFFDKDDELYSKVYQARKNHEIYFNNDYDKEIFYMITAFQNGVSQRYKNSGNSGTGLTDLVKHISGKTVEHTNYIICGDKCIYFQNEFLNVKKDGFIGFNETNNYIEDPPSKDLIGHSNIFFNGTMYQLLLIYNVESDKDGEKN